MRTPKQGRDMEGILRPQPIRQRPTVAPNRTTQPYRRAQFALSEQPAKPKPAPATQVTTQQRATKEAQQTVRQRRVAKFVLEMPDGESSDKHHLPPVIKRQARRLKTWLIRGAFAGTAGAMAIGLFLITQGFFSAQKVFTGAASSAASLTEKVDPNALKGEGDGRINVLLAGGGGPGHKGGDLTDTLILASIDPVNHKAVLVSVPRDLWVTIPGRGSMKINAAYATAKQSYMRKNGVDTNDSGAIQAGLTSIDQAMERVLGVPIHYNLLVNFTAFKQAIDTVGGVTVDVPEDLYDPTMAWENGYNSYIAREGVQQFNGKQALNYVRSRHTSSDFARGERQRAIMLALKQKIVTAGTLSNPTKLSGLISAFGNNVYTDLSLQDAWRLFGIVKQVNNQHISSASLAGTTDITSSSAGADSLITTGNINGQSIVMPKAGLESYDEIQEFARSKLQDGYIIKEKAKVLVLNGTVESGLGQSMADKLKSYGYNVTGVRNAPTTLYRKTVVIKTSNKNMKYTKNYLEQRFSTKATQLTDNSIRPGGADFVIIVGSDEAGIN